MEGGSLGAPMKALILIGGFGTRLRPITYTIPKQLIPVAGKPMLYHVLDLLPAEVEEVVLATGYKSEVIDAYVRAHPPPWPVRTVPEAEPLGTGGGMKNASEGMSDPFYLLNSDVIAAVNLPELLSRHRARGGVGTMALAEVEDTRPYGVAALGADDRITAFVEKPEPKDAPSRWINAGIAVWGRAALEAIPPGRPVSFEREIVPGLLPAGVFGFRLARVLGRCGNPGAPSERAATPVRRRSGRSRRTPQGRARERTGRGRPGGPGSGGLFRTVRHARGRGRRRERRLCRELDPDGRRARRSRGRSLRVHPRPEGPGPGGTASDRPDPRGRRRSLARQGRPGHDHLDRLGGLARKAEGLRQALERDPVGDQVGHPQLAID